MSLIASGVNSSLRDISRTDRVAGKLGRQLITGKKVEAPQDDPSAWLQASQAESTASRLNVIQTGLDEVTTNLNVVATTIEAIGKDLATMQGLAKAALTHPAGDSNRQQFINDYNTIRQQIDLLVNTTSDTLARGLMTDPAQNPQAGDVQSLVGLDGALRTIHAQVIDTGPNGLNVAMLDPLEATDADLQSALDSLGSAQSTLTARQQVLNIDTASVSRYQTQNSRIVESYQANAASLTSADPATAAVELQSINTGRSLAMQSLASISTSRSAVLELLR